MNAREAATAAVACTGADDLCGAPAGTPCDIGCPSLAADDNAVTDPALAGETCDHGMPYAVHCTGCAPTVESYGRCECEDEPVPGAWIGMNDRDEVQRCDDCARFDRDEDAARAVARVAGGVAVPHHDRDDESWWWSVVRDDHNLTADEVRTSVEAQQ